jgi:aspartate aminotransferase-like enzyme
MAGKMWRWGTMGAISEADIIAALGAFEIVIREMGYPLADGAAVNAALDVFARTGQQAESGHQPAIA